MPPARETRARTATGCSRERWCPLRPNRQELISKLEITKKFATLAFSAPLCVYILKRLVGAFSPKPSPAAHGLDLGCCAGCCAGGCAGGFPCGFLGAHLRGPHTPPPARGCVGRALHLARVHQGASVAPLLLAPVLGARRAVGFRGVVAAAARPPRGPSPPRPVRPLQMAPGQRMRPRRPPLALRTRRSSVSLTHPSHTCVTPQFFPRWHTSFFSMWHTPILFHMPHTHSSHIHL